MSRRELKLSDPADLDHEIALKTSPHRPNLNIWTDLEEEGATVVIGVGSLWGQPTRYVEMTADEAIQLAVFLKSAASELQTEKETVEF